MTFGELLVQEIGTDRLSPGEIARLEAHYQLLTRWNAKLNLTRIESLEDAVRLHYCESLFLAAALPPGPLRIADIGSGAGFPGLPIAVARPECSLTLVESHQRKAVFLREASRELTNVRVFAGRAEDLEGDFDWLVSRAVRPEDVLKLKVGANRALLVGAEDAKALGGGTELPWGKNRFLVMVPRGT